MTIIMNKEKHVGPNRSTSHVSQVATILPPAKRSLNVSVRKKETERIRLENKVHACETGLPSQTPRSHFHLQRE